jgi:hypothetical protein
MPELEASVAGIDGRTMMNIRVFTDFGFTSYPYPTGVGTLEVQVQPPAQV